MSKRERLDTLLVLLGHFGSREQAQRAILAGWVKVGGAPATKSGMAIAPDSPIEVTRPGPGYVSRGGHKLEKALEAFSIPVSGRVALDVGASTGGFTDVLLRRGARHVYAIDVGYGQLAWALRQDPRVSVLERTNIRHLTPEGLQAPPEDLPTLAVIDVSFIGLGKVLGAVRGLLAPDGEVVALIKPQFEVGREAVGKGVVRDPDLHERAIAHVLAQARDLGYEAWGLTHSPIKGPEGNIEFLVDWKPEPASRPVDVAAVVRVAHQELVP